MKRNTSVSGESGTEGGLALTSFFGGIFVRFQYRKYMDTFDQLIYDRQLKYTKVL